MSCEAIKGAFNRDDAFARDALRGQVSGTGEPDASDEDREPDAAAPDASAAAGQPQSLGGEVRYGSGQMIDMKAARRAAGVIRNGGNVTLNFVDAEITEVLRSILGATLKLNYAIDPKVKGQLTVQTSQPIPISDVLPALESVMRAHGVAIVESSGLYHVLPADVAMRGKVAPHLAGTPRRGFGVQILPLRHAAADDMVRILEPFTQKGAIMRTDKVRNMLLVAGTTPERRTMSEIVQIFDVDWFSGMSMAMVPLRFSEAKAVADDLNKVFGGEEGKLPGGLRVLPIERMNAVLAVGPNATYVRRAKVWIDKLDVGSPTQDRRLYVYHVQNGQAADLAAVLSDIFGVAQKKPVKPADGRLAPGLEPARLQSSGRTTTQTAGQQQTGTQTGLTQRRTSQTTQPAGRARTAETRTAARPRTSPAPQGAASDAMAGLRIIPHETNNALVVLATPAQYREVEAALKRLDIVPLQVIIEATIAEVELTDQLKYGVQYFFDTGNTEITLSNLASGAVSPVFPGFSVLGFTNSGNIRAVLNALDAVTDVNIISSPQLLVLDNRTAELMVGDQVPVATQSAIDPTSPGAPIVNNIEFRDTGVLLRVTPHVNASGLVHMEIEQEVSDVRETTTSGIDSPTIRQRRVKSTVAIQSGETVAMGGLIRNSRTNKSQGIPLLSRIPIFGALFGAHEDISDRNELLVLITPRVIRNQAQAREITRELRKRIEGMILGEVEDDPPAAKQKPASQQ
jgi:general secretion pathway protein D